MWVKTMPTNKGFSIVAQEDKATVYVYGGIDMFDNDGVMVDREEFIKQVADIKASAIDVRIASVGGDPVAAGQMYQTLVDHPAKVTTIVDSKAYSAGSMLLQAGDKRIARPMSMVMIHGPASPMVYGRGSAKDHREMADRIEAHAKAMIPAYTRHGIDEETVRGWLTSDEDLYFAASEALEANLIDEIVDSMPLDAMAPEDFKVAAFGAQPEPAATRRANLEAEMPKEENQGVESVAPADDFVTTHSKTVTAAKAEGARIEANRRKSIEEVFANFYDGDELSPITAAYQACMSDLKCDRLQAQQKLLNVLGSTTADPVINAHQYGTESQYQAPPMASRHLGGMPQMIRSSDDKRVEGITKALEIRAGLITDREEINKERTNEFLAMSLTDIMAHEMRQAGYMVSGTRESIARDYVRAMPVMAAGPSHSTGHLSGILADVANKAAMMGWDQSEETWNQWTQQGTLNDYREAKRANIALLETLDKMREGQEWEYGDLADVSQGIQGWFYGKKYGFTVQAMVNDDLGEITRAMNGWGEAASATVGDAVLALLTTAGTGGFGQTMDEDSTVVFHANHSNYVASGSGAAPSETTLNAGYVAMATQTDPNSRTVGIRPRYIVHGATIASTVYRQLNSSLLISAGSTTTTSEPDANWVRSLGLVPVQDHRMDAVFSGLGWYLAANRRTIEVSGVAGPLVPRVERSMTSNIPGIEYEMSMPFGCAVLDYRGLYFNYGA